MIFFCCGEIHDHENFYSRLWEDGNFLILLRLVIMSLRTFLVLLNVHMDNTENTQECWGL